MNRFGHRASAALACGAALFGLACGGSETAENASKATPAASVSAEMQLRLAAADEVDGTKDSIVARCAGCMLGMDGSAEHALEVGEFELHFCSGECRRLFAEDVEKSVLAIALPER